MADPINALPPTHADINADRELRTQDAIGTLRDAGWRQLEMVMFIDRSRQWRTVLVAPVSTEGGK